ncbi:helix-turn-helix domain protein [Ralstonia insidiosa]|uniref:Helix-turn-helix domain protein n=1 Tax=Ralstonia insidiosa TaxID=190721 RepID=A0AAC9FQJ8_9RALS|nr:MULTISPECIES: helix-turn-helix domain-containing protein [Ralstonia]ANH72832.1 helix-turn-helix domain protein [Ralstonia insidiosa]EPX96693.1 hypothetical protein C404_16930 [Ralstonia sp. AU12-08]MBY4706654.1 helix-turn-helix domain-containing protein [Ralstonia insidiosa]GAQ27702.1 araC family transcriptional regulator [Ralstonia sp. NT80]
MISNFNLDELPASKRFSYWQEIVEDLFAAVSIKCESPETFRTWRKATLLGELPAGTSLVTPVNISRTRHHVSRSSADALKVVVPLSGALAISQDKRDTLVQPGQFVLVDPARPYQENITDDLTFIWMHLPRDTVASKVSQLDKLTAIGFDRTTPYAKVAGDFMMSLSQVWNDVEGQAATHLASIALDLITMALWERLDRVNTHSTTHRSAQFQRAKAYIDERIADPSLSLGAVAAVLGVSSRYVSMLFAEAGFSYRHYVLEQRLARCADDLASPYLVHRTITDVAYSWGFYDGAHFSRAFKAAYGMSPSEFRASKAVR